MAIERFARRLAAAALALALTGAADAPPSAPDAESGAGSAASPLQTPEPDGLWQGPMRGYTPNALSGAKVLDAAALEQLIAREKPVLIDVGPADRRPASMAESLPWMPAHRSIPGAAWMPGAGSGTADPAFAESFRARIAELTGGDLNRPIVAFCHPECWGSWNAAKRLVGLGHKNVYWYPDGVEGWQAERDPVTVKPDPVWAVAAPEAQPK